MFAHLWEEPPGDHESPGIVRATNAQSSHQAYIAPQAKAEPRPDALVPGQMPDSDADPIAPSNRGRKGVFQPSGQHLVKLELGRAKARAGRLKEMNESLEDACFPEYQRAVASQFAGNPGPGSEKMMALGGSSLIMPKQKHEKGRKSYTANESLNRGTISRVEAQAAGIEPFILGGSGDTMWTFSTNQFDDASMWVRDPTWAATLKRELKLAAGNERRRRRLVCRG